MENLCLFEIFDAKPCRIIWKIIKKLSLRAETCKIKPKLWLRSCPDLLLTGQITKHTKENMWKIYRIYIYIYIYSFFVFLNILHASYLVCFLIMESTEDKSLSQNHIYIYIYIYSFFFFRDFTPFIFLSVILWFLSTSMIF